MKCEWCGEIDEPVTQGPSPLEIHSCPHDKSACDLLHEVLVEFGEKGARYANHELLGRIQKFLEGK